MNIYAMDKRHSLRDKAARCLERVQKMRSQKFNNEQCGYLVDKLNETLQSANDFLGPNSKPETDVKCRTSEDMAKCTEVFKLLLALALQIESFIRSCCKKRWLPAAMTTLANTAEYVASLGFNLELCRVHFSGGLAETKALTAAQVNEIEKIAKEAPTAAQVDEMEKKEIEIVKELASRDVHALLAKVKLELRSLRGQSKHLASYLSQRLEKVKPAATAHSPKQPFWVLLGQIFQMVRQTKQLGKGTSATVYEALWFGVSVAKKTFYGPEHPDCLQEAQVLAGLSHPNIISMFCCAMGKRKSSIVMELMDEDLHSFLQRRLDADPDSPPFSVFEAVDVILQIGEGVNYLHQNGIVHRDLKSSNVLVKHVRPRDLEVQYVLIKVADFGLSKIKESSTRYSDQGSNIGSNRWMPPEVINLRNNDGQMIAPVPQAGPKYPKKSDVYSFGMVCFEVLTGDCPFPQESDLINVKKKVLEGERPPLPDSCPSELKTLIEACWHPKPTRRPSFDFICSSLKHLKFLLMSGFHSNEDSHFKIGEPLPMVPEDAPPGDMGERKRPVQGRFHERLPKSFNPPEASASRNSLRHGCLRVNSSAQRKNFGGLMLRRPITITAASFAVQPVQWPTAQLSFGLV